MATQVHLTPIVPEVLTHICSLRPSKSGVGGSSMVSSHAGGCSPVRGAWGAEGCLRTLGGVSCAASRARLRVGGVVGPQPSPTCKQQVQA